MIAFEIYVNKRRVAIAGHRDISVLSAHVTGGSLNCPAEPNPDDPYAPHVHLSISGLTGRPSDSADEDLRWGEFLNLAVGDEVIVRIVRTDAPDPYTESTPATGKSPAPVSEKEVYDIVKQRYLELRPKYERDEG